MCEIVIGECRCGCHSTEMPIEHMMPCCYPCDVCGRNISSGYYTSHIAGCKPLPTPGP